MKPVYTITRFDAAGETCIVGINAQAYGQGKYAETTVVNSGTDREILQRAWHASRTEFDVWKTTISTNTLDSRHIHVQDTGESYRIDVSDEFMGQRTHVSEIVQKPVTSYPDIFEKAWQAIGPKLDTWRAGVTSGKIFQGQTFTTNDAGECVFD